MGGVQVKGGIPRTQRITTGTVAEVPLPFTCNWLKLRNKGSGAEVVRVYWLTEDATADANYIEVPIAAAATPNGEWEGPIAAKSIWVKAASGTPVLEVTATQRHG